MFHLFGKPVDRCSRPCTIPNHDFRGIALAGPTPNLEPTFASVQSQIFESTDVAGRQACINCHTNVGRNPSGGLNLAHTVAYDQIVNVVSARKPGAIRVILGDPENSYLVQKLEGALASSASECRRADHRS